MVFNLSERPSIANHFIAQLRDQTIQQDRMKFRLNMKRLGQLMAYEISQTLTYAEKEVETPLGVSKVNLPTQRIVLATILRAGLPFHEGFLHTFDYADNAFISAYRKHHKSGDFEVKMEYLSCPDLDDAVLILIDPMLATGASMDLTIRALSEFGTPAHVHIAAVLASEPGIKHIRRLYPKAQLWVGDIDEELTAKSYIVPGLGDAGDLSYGAKIQE